MKNLCLSAVFAMSGLVVSAQTGHNIEITLKPFKNEKIYLGYYYGKMKALADSAVLDNQSKAVFQGDKPLPGGIYFIVSPAREILFELLVDKQQKFAIDADTVGLPTKVKFINSPDNSLFQQYTLYANKTGRESARITAAYRTSGNPKDSIDAVPQIRRLSKDMDKFRDSLIAKQPTSMMSVLFKALKDPVVPEAKNQPGGKYDTAWAFNYFKTHYFDGISFRDDRLVRTPFFEAKLDKYYQNLVAPNPDSIIKEVDHMLLASRGTTEMYQYLMVHFVQKYVNPEYMGQDKVFVHLFEKYINTGLAAFFTPQYKEFLTKRAYSLMANLIGNAASDLQMVDSLGKPTTLYNVKSPYTVVFFWDPTCGHCQDIAPKLDSMYQAKWKNEGVKIYGVMVDGGQDNWQKFIKDNNLKDWIHVYQTKQESDAEAAAGKPGYRQLYDVYQTPVIYLLDESKRIIAKKLSYQQIDEVLSLKQKSTSTSKK
ncbi:MAG: thioredoxin-like domain-containing protein [Flavitalea sp.]